MKTYLYTISRKDLPLAHGSLQSCHAAIEYAYLYGRPQDGHPSLIHLTIRDKHRLEALRAALNDQGIPTAEFHELYRDFGLTAISCMIGEEHRHLLTHLPLWQVSKGG